MAQGEASSMDVSDRIESQESAVAIPEHLVFAIEEWLEERIRQACDMYEGEETRVAVTEAVRLYEAFGAGSLTPSETAELAAGAADWLQPRWPRSLEEAREVARLLTATRGLLALRDRAVATAGERAPCVEHGDPGRVHHLSTSVLAADPELVDVLRLQTLLVLEDNHEPLEEVRDLSPFKLLAAAAIFRDAIAVLDTIGWLETEQTDAMDLAITPGHLAQLQRRRAEISLTLLDHLARRREAVIEPGEIAEAEAAIAAERRAAQGLARLVLACGRPS